MVGLLSPKQVMIVRFYPPLQTIGLSSLDPIWYTSPIVQATKSHEKEIESWKLFMLVWGLLSLQ